MADFCESDPAMIRDDLVRERVQYLKTNPEGVHSMCRIMEEALEQERERAAKETRQQTVLEFVRKMVKNGKMAAQDALDMLEIPKSEQRRYLSML